MGSNNRVGGKVSHVLCRMKVPIRWCLWEESWYGGLFIHHLNLSHKALIRGLSEQREQNKYILFLKSWSRDKKISWNDPYSRKVKALCYIGFSEKLLFKLNMHISYGKQTVKMVHICWQNGLNFILKLLLVTSLVWEVLILGPRLSYDLQKANLNLYANLSPYHACSPTLAGSIR